MIRVDGPLREVVESLAKSEYSVSFAFCEYYSQTEICVIELIIGFSCDYDNFIFTGLPEHFEFVTDKKPPIQYTLNYIMNHTGGRMSAIILDYCAHPDRSAPIKVVLKEAVESLYAWSKDIEETKYPIYKLGGYL